MHYMSDVSGDACKSIIDVDAACLGPEILAIAYVSVAIDSDTGG